MKVIQNAAQFLNETGLLAEINRVVLNPRGLALSIIAEMPGPDPFEERRAASFGPLYDKRDDEGVVFVDADLAQAAAQLRAREEDGTVPVRPQRRARLGFVVQPAPGSAAPRTPGKGPGKNRGRVSTQPPSERTSSKPAVSKPAVSKPAVSKPAVSKPAVSKPASSKPASSKPPRRSRRV